MLRKLKSVCLTTIMVMCISSIGFANHISNNISTDNMYNHLLQIANKDNARVTGLEGEYKAEDYIQQEFEKYGLNVERQQFPVTARLSSSSCSITGSENKSFDSKNLTYTPSTPYEAVGIPVSFLMYEQDYNYHTDQDTIENIQLADLENTCTIVTQMVSDMGTTSFEKANNAKMLKVKENKYDKSKLDEYDFENPELVKE